MSKKQPCVYILASRPRGTLYIGVTSDVRQRVWQHRNSAFKGFTASTNARMFVWYEFHDTMERAIAREKSLKRWRRKGKFTLIESLNPTWNDLADLLY